LHQFSETLWRIYRLKDIITTLKRTTSELRKEASVFESSEDGVMITDLDGKINWALVDITEYSKKKAIGQTHRAARLLKQDRHTAALDREIWQQDRDGGILERESMELMPKQRSVSLVIDN